MDVELLEIADFLRRHVPFDTLPEASLEWLSSRLSIRYLRRGAEIDGTTPTPSIVRSGGIEARDATGRSVAYHDAGDLLGVPADGISHVATEDTLLYQLPGDTLDTLCSRHDSVAAFCLAPGGERLQRWQALAGHGDDADIHRMTSRLGDVISRPAVSLDPTASIREAAQHMSHHRVSSVLVVDGDSLAGIVTDRDLRLRVIAEGRATDRPLHDIMTRSPMTLDVTAPAHEALTLMARRGIHHLPILDGDAVAGVVTTSDFLERDSTSAVYLAADIHSADTLDELRVLGHRIRGVVASLALEPGARRRSAEVVRGLRNAVAERILQWQERELGPAPVTFALGIAGDLCDLQPVLIVDEDVEPRRHDRYFERLHAALCQGLGACGFAIDTSAEHAFDGGLTLQTACDRWRQRLASGALEPLRHIDPAFDTAHVAGDAGLLRELQQRMSALAGADRQALSRLARPVIEAVPPADSLLPTPLAAGIRLYALLAGCERAGSRERLQAMRDVGTLEASFADALDAGLVFVQGAMLDDWARDGSTAGEAAASLALATLPRRHRHHVHDINALIRALQDGLVQQIEHRR